MMMPEMIKAAAMMAAVMKTIAMLAAIEGGDGVKMASRRR